MVLDASLTSRNQERCLTTQRTVRPAFLISLFFPFTLFNHMLQEDDHVELYYSQLKKPDSDEAAKQYEISFEGKRLRL